MVIPTTVFAMTDDEIKLVHICLRKDDTPGAKLYTKLIGINTEKQ